MGCLINPRYVVVQRGLDWGIRDMRPPEENRDNFADFGEYGHHQSGTYAERLNRGIEDSLTWDDVVFD